MAEKEIRLNLKYLILLFVGVFWLTFLPAAIIGYLYFSLFPLSLTIFYILQLILLFIILYGVTLLTALIVTKIGIWIIHKRIGYPELGTYEFSMKNPQAKAYILKGLLKDVGRWLFNIGNIQFLRKIWFRWCGVKIGKNVKLAKYLIDEPLIEIGDNVFLSEYVVISSHIITKNVLTITKTVIGNNVIMDFYSGTIGSEIGDNTIFLNITGAMKGKICKGNSIYQGVMAKRVRDNDLSPDEIRELKQVIRRREKTDFIKEKNSPIKINYFKLNFMKFTIVLGGIAITSALFFLYLSLYTSQNTILNIFLTILFPFIILISIGIFLVATVLIIKVYLLYYDKKGDIPEGTYDFTDPIAKIFKIKYFLRLFGLKIFHMIPFKIADTFAIEFWGNVILGKNVVLYEAVIDPQYLEIGDNVTIAPQARIHTHMIIDNQLYVKKVKIGNNVEIGAFAHINAGVQIADESVIAVGAWLRKNLKCKKPALWIGKPAYSLPLEMITYSTGTVKKTIE